MSYILDQGQKVMLPNVLENYLPTNAGYQSRLAGMKAENTANIYMKQVLYSTIAEHGDFNHSEGGKPSETKSYVIKYNIPNAFIDKEGKVIPYERMTKYQKESYEIAVNPSDTSANNPQLGEYRSYFDEIDNSLEHHVAQYLQERNVKKS